MKVAIKLIFYLTGVAVLKQMPIAAVIRWRQVKNFLILEYITVVGLTEKVKMVGHKNPGINIHSAFLC